MAKIILNTRMEELLNEIGDLINPQACDQCGSLVAGRLTFKQRRAIKIAILRYEKAYYGEGIARLRKDHVGATGDSGEPGAVQENK